jgi:crotonobetainyl-CoA:carnitine CoA-transferase CaiB-like acyl-CoA transferase
MAGFPDRLPLKPAIWVMDGYGAMMGAGAVLIALHYRNRTGKRQFMELSQSENGIRMLAQWYLYQSITGKEPRCSGNRDLCICPSDTFRTKDDRFIAISVPQPHEFEGLCKAMGQPLLAQNPKFKDQTTRLKNENAVEILKIISNWANTKTADEIDTIDN